MRDQLHLAENHIQAAMLYRQMHHLDACLQHGIQASIILKKHEPDLIKDHATRLHYAQLLMENGKSLLRLKCLTACELLETAVHHFHAIYSMQPSQVNRIHTARSHYQLGYAYWIERLDVGQTLKHYLISHLMAPSVSPFPFDTTPLIRWSMLQLRSAVTTINEN